MAGQQPQVNLQQIFAKMKPREKIFVFAAGATVFGAMVVMFILAPILSKMDVMDADIEARKETIRQDRRVMSFSKRILDEYYKSQGYLDAQSTSREQIISALLKRIESLAKQQSIAILNMKPGDVEEKPTYQIYRTGIECEGKLNDLLEFMTQLEQSDRLFLIVKYSMAPKSKGAEIIKCSLDVIRTLISAEEDLPEEFKKNEPAPDEAAAPAAGMASMAAPQLPVPGAAPGGNELIPLDQITQTPAGESPDVEEES